MSNQNSGNVSVLLGNGDGTFSAGQSFAVGSRPSSVNSDDLDEDSVEDLAVSNFDSDNVSILCGNGGGSFQAAENFPAGDGPAFVIGAHLNTDSFADLAVANQNSNNISVLLNTTVKTAPAAPVISGPPEGGRVGSSFTVSGTAEPNSTVQLSEGTASKGSTTVSSTGNWSILLSGITEGSHTYTAKATDTAGSSSAESNPRTVTVDTTAPTVVSTTPPNQTTGVGRGISPTATFSEKIKASTIKAATFKLLKVNPDRSTTQITDVVVSLSSDGLTAKLNPFGTTTTVLASNTKYKAVVTVGAKDLAGNSLAQQKSWTFTTKP